MSLEYRPQAESGLETRVVDEQVLVHDSVHDKVHLLNASAGRVLELCDGRRTIDDIVVLMLQSGVDRARVSQDVASILQSFALLRLITEAPPV